MLNVAGEGCRPGRPGVAAPADSGSSGRPSLADLLCATPPRRPPASRGGSTQLNGKAWTRASPKEMFNLEAAGTLNQSQQRPATTSNCRRWPEFGERTDPEGFSECAHQATEFSSQCFMRCAFNINRQEQIEFSSLTKCQEVTQFHPLLGAQKHHYYWCPKDTLSREGRLGALLAFWGT